jgi:hypothetical protein
MAAESSAPGDLGTFTAPPPVQLPDPFDNTMSNIANGGGTLQDLSNAYQNRVGSGGTLTQAQAQTFAELWRQLAAQELQRKTRAASGGQPGIPGQ